MFPKSLFRLLPAGLLLFTGPRSGAQPPTTIDLDAIPAVELHLERTISDQGEPLFSGGFGCTLAFDHSEAKLYVSDRNEIHIIADDGTLLRTVGRAGQGPGEFQIIQRILPLPERIIVADRLSYRLTIFSKDFSYLRTIPLQEAPDDLAEVPSSDRLVVHRNLRGNTLLYILHPERPIPIEAEFLRPIDSFPGFSANYLMRNSLRIAATASKIFAFHKNLPALKVIELQTQQTQEIYFTGPTIERLRKVNTEIQSQTPGAMIIFTSRVLRGPDGLIYWGQNRGEYFRIIAFNDEPQAVKAYQIELQPGVRDSPQYINFSMSEHRFFLMDPRRGCVDVYGFQK